MTHGTQSVDLKDYTDVSIAGLVNRSYGKVVGNRLIARYERCLNARQNSDQKSKIRQKDDMRKSTWHLKGAR